MKAQAAAMMSATVPIRLVSVSGVGVDVILAGAGNGAQRWLSGPLGQPPTGAMENGTYRGSIDV
jgi:hypothetical protein